MLLPERQVVAGWPSGARGQPEERLGAGAGEMWLETGGWEGVEGTEARRPQGPDHVQF